MNKISETPSYDDRVDGAPIIDRRSVLLGLGLAGGAALSYLHTPRALAAQISEEQFQRMMPQVVGGWRSRTSNELVLPGQDDLQAKLYENLETRIYEGAGLPSIMMLIAYSSIQQNDVQVHRPEVCYPVSGYPILATKEIAINFGPTTINARDLVADRHRTKEHIIYWVRVGDKYPVGWAEQRFEMAKLTAISGIPDGLLFRVSVFEEDPNYTKQSLERFISSFEKSSSKEFKKAVLLGDM